MESKAEYTIKVKEPNKNIMKFRSITIPLDEPLESLIYKLIAEYTCEHIHRPDTLYCSPMGYIKLQAYLKYTYMPSHLFGLKPIVVPSLSKEFVVYNSDSEDYYNMIQEESHEEAIKEGTTPEGTETYFRPDR